MGILSLILALLGLMFGGFSVGGGGGSGNSPFEVTSPAVQEGTVTPRGNPAGGSDYGDAPPPYGIASHSSQDYDWLGILPTVDDGISWSPLNMIPGQEASITFMVSSYNPLSYPDSRRQYVNIWADWDQSGGWEAIEQIVGWYRYVTVLPGTQLETFTESFLTPLDAMIGTTWLRARLARGDVGPVSTGVKYGECEDYEVKVIPEPATMVLLSSGLLALALAGFRRRFDEEIWYKCKQ